MKYIYKYTKHAIKTTHLRSLYTNQTHKKMCDKKHNCGPGKVHSPLPAHCREASKPSSCTLQEGQRPLSAPCREASQLLSCALMGGQQASLIQVRATVKSVAINPCKKPCEWDAYLKLLKSEYMSKDHLPQAGLACLPVQEEGTGLYWPISLIRTGLSSCSGRGSRTGLAFLPAPEQGPRLDWPVSLLRKRVLPLGQDWPPCPRRGTWTLQEPILCCLSQPFWAYININS